MKWVHRGALIAGLGLLVGLLWGLGPGALFNQLRALGSAWFALVALEGLAEALHVSGWRHCLSGRLRRLPWVRIAMVRQAGMAFNYLTPTAHMGGEVVKGSLLVRWGGGAETASAILVGKLALAASQILFVAAGSSVALWLLSPPLEVIAAWLGGTLLFSSGIAAFFILQRTGRLGSLFRFLHRRGWGGRITERLASYLLRVDQALSGYYRDRPGDLLKAMAWHMGAFHCGLLQTWIFFLAAGLAHPWSSGIVVYFLGTWFDLMGFIVPAGVGVQEGSRVLLFHSLGLASVSGLAYGVTIRILKALWAGVGLLCYGLLTMGNKEKDPL